MVDDHEDYETGAAPAAHKVSHQDGGTDEISVAGLSGETARLAAHKILPSVHHLRYTDFEAAAAAAALILIHKGDAVAHQDAPQLILDHKGDAVAHQDAPQLILDHKGDASAHHAKYTDGAAQTVADARILIHKNIATAHQDAPDLILTHKGDASAHHGRYTDGEARAVHSPLSIHPSLFTPYSSTYGFNRTTLYLQNRAALTMQYFTAPVTLPPGVTITKITLYGHRDDADATLQLKMRRSDKAGSQIEMSSILADWSDGAGSKYDDTIGTPVIDNTNYTYSLLLYIDPNDDVDDVKLYCVDIEFTG